MSETMTCSECGKEIQSEEKFCKECKKKRLLREKIISENYRPQTRFGKGIGDIL